MSIISTRTYRHTRRTHMDSLISFVEYWKFVHFLFRFAAAVRYTARNQLSTSFYLIRQQPFPYTHTSTLCQHSKSIREKCSSPDGVDVHSDARGICVYLDNSTCPAYSLVVKMHEARTKTKPATTNIHTYVLSSNEVATPTKLFISQCTNGGKRKTVMLAYEYERENKITQIKWSRKKSEVKWIALRDKYHSLQ